MRLFIAINFEPEIKDRLMEISKELQNRSIKGSFTFENNLHLTLAFIGETAKLTETKKAMDAVFEKPFGLCLNGLGKFRRLGGDIYWVGVERNEALLRIYQQIYTKLTAEGFALENREYTPHLTLGRQVILQENQTLDDLGKMFLPISQKVEGISLMKSERINGRLTYTEIYARKLS